MGVLDDIDFISAFNKLSAKHRKRLMALSDEDLGKVFAKALEKYMKSGDGILRKIIKPGKVG